MPPNNRNITVNITNRTIFRAILWVVGTIALFKFVGKVEHILTLIFAAFFLALALNPVVGWISKHLHIQSRVRATAMAYLLVVAFLGLFFALIIPPLVNQTQEFIKNVPETVENFQQQNNGIARAIERYDLDERFINGAKDFAANYSDFGATIVDTGRRIAEVIASVFAVLVMTFMMLVEGPRWFQLYFSTLPTKKRQHHKRIAFRMYKAVSGYVNGQVILAAVAGFFAFIALEIAGQVLDVPSNALALGGIVAVFGIIPLFGNPIAATLVVLVSLLNSVTLAIVMAIYFTVYFFIENHTFQPYIQSRLNELTPLLVFIAAITGVAFAGILGAVVAIPAATSIKILVEDYYERRKLHNTQKTEIA